MNNPIRTGTMIALTATTLFAAACSKPKHNSDESSAPAASISIKPSPTSASGSATPDPAAQPEKVATVHCSGVNSCTGKSGCKTAKNACSGQNGCKGQGYLELTAEECQTKGGKILAEK